GNRTGSRPPNPCPRTPLHGEPPYPWDLLQAQDEMSRHRGAKHCRRYGLLGSISLLSPAYLLSVERWPSHLGPPDHYGRLSTLLDLSVSQSGWLMPLHSTSDFRPLLANLRAPPLLCMRRPPQSNYPQRMVPDPDNGSRLDIKQGKGGISREAPQRLASLLRSLSPSLHMPGLMPVRSYSKGARGLSV